MFNIGDTVKVIDVFAQFFPDTYLITDIKETTVWLEGIEPAFDFIYLEKVI